MTIKTEGDKPSILEALLRHAAYYLSLSLSSRPVDISDLEQIKRAQRQLLTGRVERLLPPLEQRTG